MLKGVVGFAIIKEMEWEMLCVQILSPNYTVRKLQPIDADIKKIYTLASQNTLFYQYHPPFVTQQSILDDMSALPPGKTMADKFYIGFFDGAVLAAVVDLILAYPDESTAYIGFFMVDKSRQGQGIGSRIVADIENAMRENGILHSRLAVDKGNPQSYAFWTKNGYTVCGPAIPNDFSAYIPMQKELSPL